MSKRRLPQLNIRGLGGRVPPRLSFLTRPEGRPLNLLPATVRPLIVLPGILGTWPPAPAPRGRLDPITLVYHNLLDGLKSIGYRPGTTLFSFPYDWRRSVEQLARDLQHEIKRIQHLGQQRAGHHSVANVDYSRVDLLCHSMGGVIARAYIQGEHYQDDVARLLLVASPQQGSAAAYYAYEGADTTLIGLPVEGAQGMVKLIDAFEARSLHRRTYIIYQAVRKLNQPDLHAYLNRTLRSLKDILPLSATGYLYSLSEGCEIHYPFGQPDNSLLEGLQKPDSLVRLDRLEEIRCVYSSSQRTLTRIQVEPSANPPYYEHGQPVSPQPAANYTGGDNLVTAASARLCLPPVRPDGRPWQVRCENVDLSEKLGRSLTHVEITGDPEPVRYLLGFFVGPDAPPLTPEMWNGPAVSARRPNYRALFI